MIEGSIFAVLVNRRDLTSMLFSVIVPVYKVEKYLQQCVESILMQTWTDYELILVNDGSPDSCPSICDDYSKADNRVVVIHKKNEGLSLARNTGLDRAKGDYIVFLDSDDFFLNEKCLESIAKKTEKNPDIIMYKTAQSDESGKQITYPNMDTENLSNESISEMLRDAVTNECFQTSAWSKTVKRSLLVDQGIKFKENLLGEDIDWYLQVIRLAKSFEIVHEYIYVYRRRRGSITTSFGLKNLKDLIWILNKWNEILKDSPVDIQLRHYLGKTYVSLLIMYADIKDPGKKQFKQAIKAMSSMLRCDHYPRTKIVNRCYTLAGFNLTVFILKIIIGFKRKFK